MQNHLRSFLKNSILKPMCFLRTTFFSKVVVFYLRTTFLMEKRVLQVSGRNTLENASKITSKSKFSTQNVHIPYHLHPALSPGWGPGPGWGPYGPLWAHMGPYGPLWALMGPYGPIWAHMGPIWVLLDRSGHDQITTFGPIYTFQVQN